MRLTPRASPSSFTRSIPPNSSRARRIASSRGTPPRTKSSAYASMWKRSAAALPSAMNEAGSRASHFLRLGPQDCSDHLRHAIPLFSFSLESAFTRGREPVIFRPAFIFRLAPFTGDPPLVFETIQGGVQRALLNFQAIFRNLLNAQQDAVAVQRAQGNRLEDEHVERALQKVKLLVHGILLS